jgi:hypothetical protein
VRPTGTSPADRPAFIPLCAQQLHRPQVAGGLVDDQCLGPPERMRAVILAPWADGCHPLVHQPGTPPSADVLRSIGSAWEGVVVKRATSVFQPGLVTGARRLEQLELDRSARLFLHNRGSGPNTAAADEFTDPDFHDVAASQFAVDGKIEQCRVTQPSLSIEPEPDRLYLLRLERVPGSHHPSSIPRQPVSGYRVEL